MAYVTDDRRVQKIIKAMRQKIISEAQARIDIGALLLYSPPPQKNPNHGYLDWEVQAAIEEAYS